MANVLLHLVLGLVLAVAFACAAQATAGAAPSADRAGGVALRSRWSSALWLVWVGNLREHRWMLNAHVVSSLLGVVALLPFLFRLGRIAGRPRTLSLSVGNAALLAAALPLATAIYVKANPNPNDRIVNPSVTPASMDEEGGGPDSPFFPSSAKTNVGGIIPSNFFMDSETLRHLPQGHLRAVEQLGAPFRVVQQPVLPEVDRVHAGGGRHAAEQVVRGLPRPRGVLQRPVRHADQGADRHAGSAGRTRLHVVSCHHARAGIDGAGRFHHRVPGAARADEQQEQVHPRDGQLHDLSEPGAAPPDVHEAVHDARLAGVLLVVPQGPPRRAGERLSLVPRLQRLRRLAGERRLRPGGALLLLPADRR